MRVAALVLLGSLAFTAQAQNCTKPSGGPSMSLKDSAILQNTFPDGSNVSFACNVGYTSAGGSATIICTAGKWSTLRLVCERKSCGALPEVDHGTIDYPNGDALFGDKAVVTCNLGYILVGKNEIRCGAQGWMDRPPVCEVVTCSRPGQIENGVFNPQKESYTYRDVVRYVCDTGFTLNGSRELTCSEDEQFHLDPPKCVWVECQDPAIANSEFVEGSRPPHKISASIKYICKTGYDLIGQSTITCNINSQWSPELPVCRAKSCSKPSGGSNMHLMEDAVLQNTFPDGSSVYFECNVGYTPAEGPATITCTAGTWSALRLVCKRKSCGALSEVEHGTITYSSGGTLFGDKAVITCNSGYTLVGEKEITCGDQGWMGKSKCEEVSGGDSDNGTAVRTGIIVAVVILVAIFVLVCILLKKSKHTGHVGPTLLGVKCHEKRNVPRTDL
ncbi:membrane cofactor protein isoform X2 [Nematolebias whitei]|uniref:membrane cofactor protein isoform X2 n=1 Tax=Nematolebias whitei TaxID=451745 RepID=UPI0018981EA2|nr:membrane cofactor protein isoform X2 [Nematolebias whitei]